MLAHPWIQGSIRTTPVKSSSVQNKLSVGNLRANTFQNETYSLYPQHRKNDEQNENTVMNGSQIPGREEFMDVTVRNGTAFAQMSKEERKFKGCLPNIFSRKNSK